MPKVLNFSVKENSGMILCFFHHKFSFLFYKDNKEQTLCLTNNQTARRFDFQAGISDGCKVAQINEAIVSLRSLLFWGN